MRLTTKGRFAVTAMVDLALLYQRGPVTLAAISKRQDISLSYLEQLFGKLRRQQLVDSMRGPGGGYVLARDPADISIADVILAVDEPLDATQCSGKENCLGDHRCLTHNLWEELNARMIEFLDSVSLKKLVDEQKNKGETVVFKTHEEVPLRRSIAPRALVKPVGEGVPNSVFSLASSLK